jgi:hypothetical protein
MSTQACDGMSVEVCTAAGVASTPPSSAEWVGVGAMRRATRRTTTRLTPPGVDVRVRGLVDTPSWVYRRRLTGRLWSTASCLAAPLTHSHAQLGIPETAHGPTLEYRQLPHGSSTLSPLEVSGTMPAARHRRCASSSGTSCTTASCSSAATAATRSLTRSVHSTCNEKTMDFSKGRTGF